MAPRDLMNSTAMDTVFDNLGMDAADLGVGNDNVGDDFGSDDNAGGDDVQAGGDHDDFSQDDDAGDDDPFAVDDGFEDNDQSRVTHTGQPQDRQQQRQQRQQLTRQQQPPTRGRYRQDAKGNVINSANAIVAKAGKEARLFWTGEKYRKASALSETKLRDTAGRLSRVVSIAEQLKAKHDAYVAREKAISDLGVSAEDQISAIQLFTQLKKDAKGTLTKLLTRAAANGITIDGGTGGQQGQLPTNVADIVKEVLGGELKPLKEFITSQQTQQENARRANEARQSVQAEVGQWFEQNPKARPYLSVIHRVLQNPQYSHMSLGEIWARIQLNQARNPDRRLRTPNGQGRSTPQSRRGSPPTGRGMPPSGTDQMANVNDSWDSIVRGVLDQAGV